jgi:hypothetical protein
MTLSLTDIRANPSSGSMQVQRLGSQDPGDVMAAAQLRAEFDLRYQVQRPRMWLQDLWYLSYLAVDRQMDLQLETRPRYYTPKAGAIVDTARRVLARNPIRYHLAEPHTGHSTDERLDSRVLENVLHGLLFDIDRQMVARGENNSRMTAAWQGVLRGQWAYKLHLSKQADTHTGSPAHYAGLDPRLCLPTFDTKSQQDAIQYNFVTIGQLFYQYEDVMRPLVDSIRKSAQFGKWGTEEDLSFMHLPLLAIEWSTRDEHALLLDTSGLPNKFAEPMGVNETEHSGRRYVWLQAPFKHGFGQPLIRIGNMNGVPVGIAGQEAAQVYAQSLMTKNGAVAVASGAPNVSVNAQTISPTFLQPTASPTSTAFGNFIDPAGAMVGRSILAPVADMFPQFNSMLALLKQGVESEIRGTWTFRSRGGQMVNFELGTGAVNPLNLNEALERVQPNLRAIDAIQVLQMIQAEINEASLDLRFVLGSDFEGSGFLRQRMEQGALIALTDYEEGMANWAVSVAESFMNQYRHGHEHLGEWKMHGRQPGPATQFFVVDMDDQVKEILLEGKEPPVVTAKTKVSLPIDMAARINMAKAAIDPNNPVMSLQQAIDLILEIDDADQAHDNILQDIGSRNPTIQLLKISEAFRRAGAPELADMIMNDQFKQAFNNATQQGATTTQGGAAVGTSPTEAPVQSTTGGNVGSGGPTSA